MPVKNNPLAPFIKGEFLKSPLTKGDIGGCVFSGAIPVPRFHEDKFHEDKFTTPVLPLCPHPEGDRGEACLEVWNT